MDTVSIINVHLLLIDWLATQKNVYLLKASELFI